MPEPLLTTQEAAAYLHLSPKTLEKWRVVGGGPRYRKLGKLVVYTQLDIDAWVEAQARTSTSDPGPGPPTPSATVYSLPRRGSRAKR